jgi:hypothetical protein
MSLVVSAIYCGRHNAKNPLSPFFAFLLRRVAETNRQICMQNSSALIGKKTVSAAKQWLVPI